MTPVDVVVEDGVAVLTLDRPKVNAYDLDLMEALSEAVDRVGSDPAVGAVVLRSAMPTVFCVGADIRAWGANSAAANRRLVDAARGVAAAIGRSDSVFLAAINGHALGGGLELAMACDLRFAAEGDYQLGLPEVKLGLMPGNGGTQRLLRLVGPSIALELIAGGESISPARAAAIGLVNRVVPADRLLDESRRYALGLAQGPREAVAAIKRAIRLGGEERLAEGLAVEAELADALYDTTDGIEGFAAYTEKRPPVFSGARRPS